jgi:SAM-dependent methyltransferase
MARWVLELVDEYLPEGKVFLDYDSKYPDFLSTINEAKKFDRVISISHKLPKEEDLFPKDMIIYDDMSLIEEKVHVFTAFEVLDRIFAPAEFIKEAHRVCRSGGLFFLTTNTISGFEYQMLGDKSPRLHPPDRINLLSIEAIHNRLTESGFEVIELSTPGRLDVEIVRNALESNPEISTPEFFKYIFKNRDERTWHSFQDFLQQNRLSSYIRVAARRK